MALKRNKCERPNYLRDYKKVMHYFMSNYDLPRQHIEFLFWIYNLRSFKRKQVNTEWQSSADFSTYGVTLLLNKGFIQVYHISKVNGLKTYKISHLGKRLVTRFYKSLHGETPIIGTKHRLRYDTCEIIEDYSI